MTRTERPEVTSHSTWIAVGVLLSVHVGLVASIGARQSPNVDEPAHLAGGLALWQYGVFDIYKVNPPLVRAVAAVPILFFPHEDLWGDFQNAPQPRPEFILGSQLFESHPVHWEQFLVAGRWALLPFTALGGVFCFLWARDLFGQRSGLLALVLWCFSPNVLAWSSVVGTDAAAASLGIAAGYVYWRWLKRPTLQRTICAGALFGLAQLAKMTWIVLFFIWMVLWVIWSRRCRGNQQREPHWTLMALVLLIGWNVLNLGYVFEGTFTPLGKFTFFSRTLAGETFEEDVTSGANRFTDTFCGRFPVPLPKAYLEGIDLQRRDFEIGKPSYLFGRWTDHGWWYYYLVGLLLKVPLGTWGLGVLALWNVATAGAGCRQDSSSQKNGGEARGDVFDVLVLLLPALAMLVFVSSQDGFSIHFRYVLPILPFAFVGVSSVANSSTARNTRIAALIWGLMTWTIVSSLRVYPDCISYFNELTGGPLGGHHYMLGSSLSWTNNRFALREWLRDHPEADSPYMQLDHSISLERLGLFSRGEPPKSNSENVDPEAHPHAVGPVPGWHLIDIQRIHDRDRGSLYFLDLKPVETIGCSTNIYHVDIDDANHLRREMRLPELTPLSRGDLIVELADAQRSQGRIDVAILGIEENSGSGLERIRTVLQRASNINEQTLSAEDIQRGRLDSFDVLLVPGGNASLQGASLGERGRSTICRFVDRGGGYIGICAGAYLAATNHDWSLKIINARTLSGARFVPGIGNVNASNRGWGKVELEMTDNGIRIFNLTKHRIQLNYTGGPVFYRANEASLSDYEVLATFRSEIVRYPFQKGTMVNTPAILVSHFGNGKVILFSAHPELGGEHELLLTDAVRSLAR